jgi:GNAT superfamily N-acetyltransferase
VAIQIRLGGAADVEAAVSVFERSNAARRLGVWPSRAARVERLKGHLDDPACRLVVAVDGAEIVGMATAEPLREPDESGPVVPRGCFLGYLFVVPERWAEGIGGALLDAVLAEAKHDGYDRIHLWTHEDNERSHRLYGSRGFTRTGRSAGGEDEWACGLGTAPEPD